LGSCPTSTLIGSWPLEPRPGLPRETCNGGVVCSRRLCSISGDGVRELAGDRPVSVAAGGYDVLVLAASTNAVSVQAAGGSGSAGGCSSAADRGCAL